jgi:hypothetical protein
MGGFKVCYLGFKLGYTGFHPFTLCGVGALLVNDLHPVQAIF